MQARELDDVEDFYVDEGAEFSAADEAVFNAFMHAEGVPGSSSQPGPMLSDLVMAKLRQRVQKTADTESADAASRGPSSEMSATMEQIYTDIGVLLQRCALLSFFELGLH